MATVDELRNEIRRETGRFEREISADFTKEDLLALCETLDVTVESQGRPSKSRMRTGIREAVGLDADDGDGSFRKAELEAVAAAVRDD